MPHSLQVTAESEVRETRFASPVLRFTGLLAILAAITMFFAALASAYVVRRGLSLDWVPLRLPGFIWITPFLLLVLNIFISKAHSAFEHGRSIQRFSFCAASAGVTFLVLSACAWRSFLERGSTFSSTPSAAFFYVLTGVFAVLALSGTVALLVMALRRPAAASTLIGAADIYWKYLAALWLCLLGLFFFWS